MLWKIILPVFSIVSLVYYVALLMKLKKPGSTFSWFWLLAGLCGLVLWRYVVVFPDAAQSRLWGLCIPPILFFLWVEGLVISNMKSDAPEKLPYIIVLGAHVEGTQVTDSLARRLECACTYLHQNPKTIVIVSGGQGRGEEITEAKAMAAYLCGRGIDKDRILLEDKSKTTKENLLFSRKYMTDSSQSAAIVTNNFHMYRACAYARKIGYRSVKRLSAGCNSLLLVNYVVREFFAVLKLWIFF